MLVDVKDKFASLKIVKLLKDKIDVLEKWTDKGRLEGSEKGTNSIAFGYETTASGKYSYANGWKNVASGDYSRAEGLNTTASGYNSHSEGRDTIASGDTAHAEGNGTIASCNNQHTEGSYNIEDTEGKYLHIVGNGTSDTDRSNAHTLDSQGNAWYAGDISNETGSLNGLSNKVSKLISCTIQARNFESSVELTNLITALENNFQESTIGSTFNSTETDSTSSFWFGLKTSSSSGIALIISNLGLIYAVRKSSLNNDTTAWYIDDSKILSIPKTIT